MDIKEDKNGKREFQENDKAEVIRRIFTEYSRGAGIRTIVRALNRDKIPTHGRGNQSHGNGWAATHVRRILGYRQVLGEYQPCKHVVNGGKKCRIPDGEAVLNYYPAIVNKPLFYKVQQMPPKSNGRGFTGGHARGRTGNVTNLFKGFVKCRHCGGSAPTTLEEVIGKEYEHQPLSYQQNVDNTKLREARWDASPVARAAKSLDEVWNDSPSADARQSLEKINATFLKTFEQDEHDVVKRFLYIASPLLKSAETFGISTIFPFLQVWQIEPNRASEIFARWTAYLIKLNLLRKAPTVYDTEMFVRNDIGAPTV